MVVESNPETWFVNCAQCGRQIWPEGNHEICFECFAKGIRKMKKSDDERAAVMRASITDPDVYASGTAGFTGKGLQE